MLRTLLVVSLLLFPPFALSSPAADHAQGARLQAPWTTALEQRLAEIDAELHAGSGGELGVVVLDAGSGAQAALRGDEHWYLASGVKVPVAVAVLRAVQAGELSLDDTLVLRPDDFVDGAGATNRHPAGTALRVDWLIEQMLVHSDNTATDVLVRRVGIEALNATAKELLGGECGTITTLADVRRHAYSHFHERAFELSSADLLAIKRASPGRPRVAAIAERLGVPDTDLRAHDMDAAFEAYYASRLNAAPLSAYARMLAAIAAGEVLDAARTDWLLDVMARVETGHNRVRAGLPPGVRFAHKTGTQHRRSCDFGLASTDAGRELVVVVCSRGAGLRPAERAMRAVGAAVSASGALDAAPPRDAATTDIAPAAP